MPKTNLLVFFVFRTGSSYVMQALRSCEDTYVFGDYGEVLTLSEIKKTGFAKDLMLQDTVLESYAFDKLEGYLRYLAHYSPDNIVCSKISLFQIEQYINNRSSTFESIIKNKNTKILILTRNALDIYISWQKARDTKQWGWLDTTGLKVDVDVDQFSLWNGQFQNSYKNLFKYLDSLNKKYVTLDYDELNKLYNDNSKINLIIKKLKTIDVNLVLDYTRFKNTKFLVKQDRNSKHQYKIKDFDKFKEKLIEKKLGHYLK